MSQSPINDFSARATTRYRQGWKALNRLLHQDRSFSGREANCAFLNMGQGQFADISAASGLDYLDDARAVGVVDWDFDGDLDLWITNRTAPRVRFLRNELVSPHTHLAVKLEGNGTTTNRNAIGARLELYLADTPPQPLIKTLHAGDSFLSQSSQWVHFGLGRAGPIDRLVVRWPGGASETFRGLSAGHWYVIEQGSSRGVEWLPPQQRNSLVASEPKLAPRSEQARIVLPARLPLPSSMFTDVEGHDISIQQKYLNQPVLVNLWASWCPPCLAELSEWTAHEQQITSRGLSILTLGLDGLEERGDRQVAKDLLERLSFPFASAWATERLVMNFDLFQRAVLDRWRPLPVPSSFLIDQHGQVAVIYKGPVAADQVIADLELLDLSPHALRKRAVPFPGRWITDPGPADPLRVCSQFIDHTDIQAGISYLERYAASFAPSESGEVEHRRLGDIYYVLGVLLGEQNHADESLEALRQAATHSPDDFRIRRDLASELIRRQQHNEAAEQLEQALGIRPHDLGLRRLLGMLRFRQREFDDAIELFSEVLESQPTDTASRWNLANSYRASGDYRSAVAQYREILRQQPRNPLAANNLAWILSTHRQPALRNGAEAVSIAEQLIKTMKGQDPNAWDTLAAAYAEVGRFADAVAAVEKAIQLATEEEELAAAAAMKNRLRGYQSMRPHRDQ